MSDDRPFLADGSPADIDEVAPSEVERVRLLLECQEWTFAKSMPHNPHWYTLRKRWVDDYDFIYVVRFIRKYGVTERYPPGPRGRAYRVLHLGDYFYWTMGCPIEPGVYDPTRDTILINRKPEPHCSRGSGSTLFDAGT